MFFPLNSDLKERSIELDVNDSGVRDIEDGKVNSLKLIG